MKEQRIGLIRVVSFEDQDIVDRHGCFLEETFPGLRVLSRCIHDQPKGVHDDESEAAAIPRIVDLGRTIASEEGIDALIISCAADPGVLELREQLDIPVFGAGASVAALALAYGRKIGVLGIIDRAPAAIREVLGAHLIAEAKPEGVTNTLDLMEESGREAASAAVRELGCAGVEVIALACTGFTTIGYADELERIAGVPVLDAVMAAGLAASSLMRKHR